MIQLWRSRGRVFLPRALSFLFAASPVASLAIIASETAFADDPAAPGSNASSSLFDQAKAAVVQVRSGDKGFVLAGSGFFIDSQGTVLTSSTILGDNTSARVVVNGVEQDAKIIGNDPFSGLAMLRVSCPIPSFLPLGHSGEVQTGNEVMMIGYPMNLAAAPSQGQVSGFDTSYLSKVENNGSGKDSVAAVERFSTTHIHANLAVSPGQIGGPLLNGQGEVIGLSATSPDDGKTVYALPSEAISKIIADFNIHGRALHGWVGIKVVEAPDNLHDGRTVRVVQIVPGTPASRSGIAPGDTVMRIDSREIYRPADVLDASFFSKVGANMTVVIRRDEKLYDYSFAVIERPEDPPSSTGPAVHSSTTSIYPSTGPAMAGKVVADRE